MAEPFQFQLEEPRIAQRARPGINPVEIPGIGAARRSDPGSRVFAKQPGMLMRGHGRIHNNLGVGAECSQGHAIEQYPQIIFPAKRCLLMGGEADMIEVLHPVKFWLQDKEKASMSHLILCVFSAIGKRNPHRSVCRALLLDFSLAKRPSKALWPGRSTSGQASSAVLVDFSRTGVLPRCWSGWRVP